MHIFDYANIKLNITEDLIQTIASIGEFKGEQNLFLDMQADALSALAELAKIQSTEASNKIEGIYTNAERLKQLVLDKTNPKNRSEKEIAGYRNILKLIHENYKYIPVKPSYILQMHKELYIYSEKNYGGKYKAVDNFITQENELGETLVRFRPIPAWETPSAMEGVCEALAKAEEKNSINALLLIPMFILDFLCIHPFNDGNGRMSRLLTLLLFYRAGFNVGKYVSIEKKIEQTKESYYDALFESSQGWHENKNDYMPFIKYMLGVLLAAYRDFKERVNILEKPPTKSQRISELIKNKLGAITKSEIRELCFDISDITIQRTLADLTEKGDIKKIGGGRYTKYVWSGDRR